MRLSLLVIACLVIVLITLALPWESSFRLRAGRERAIEDAVQRLADERHETRRRATNLLVSMGEEARGPVLSVYASTDAEVRRRAGAILEALDSAGMDPRIRRQREYVTIITVALDCPGELRPGSNRFVALGLDPERATLAAVLVAKAEERRPDRHERAVALVCDLGRGSGAAYLAELLARGTFPPSLLYQAAEGLIQFGGPEVLPRIREALERHDEAARRQSLRVLARLGAPADADLARGMLLDPSAAVRVEAAAALSAVAGRLAAEDLAALTEDPDSAVRATAVAELARLDLPEAGERAVRALSDPTPEVREAALDALALVRDPAYAGAVESLGTDLSVRVRAAAVRALTAIVSPESAVLAGSRDGSPAVRREALLACRLLPLARRREILGSAPAELDTYLCSLRRSVLSPVEAN